MAAMEMPGNPGSWLLADVGGTHTRCALAGGSGDPHSIRVVENDSEGSLQQLLLDYISEHAPPPAQIEAAAIGVAAPITGDEVAMLNRNWHFSTAELKRELGLYELKVINDFAAQALALPHLRAGEHLDKLGGGAGATGEAMAVLGPGTGLGVSGLIPFGQEWATITGEGGHITLAATNDLEAALVSAVRRRYGHCSAERLLCGPGLVLLHETMTALHGDPQILTSKEVSARAIAGDERASATLAQFFAWLGAVAGDLALTLGARSGVFIAGGIAPALAEQLKASEFRQRFESKGRFQDWLASIPTWLITAETPPALIGLAALLRQSDRQPA